MNLAQFLKLQRLADTDPTVGIFIEQELRRIISHAKRMDTDNSNTPVTSSFRFEYAIQFAYSRVSQERRPIGWNEDAIYAPYEIGSFSLLKALKECGVEVTYSDGIDCSLVDHCISQGWICFKPPLGSLGDLMTSAQRNREEQKEWCEEQGGEMASLALVLYYILLIIGVYQVPMPSATQPNFSRILAALVPAEFPKICIRYGSDKNNPDRCVEITRQGRVILRAIPDEIQLPYVITLAYSR